MVREYKGSHSGEHGDGLVRSEFNEPMFGSRLARAFEEVKDRFDPNGLFNPGQGGAAAEIRRPLAVPLRARLSRRGRSKTRSTGRPSRAPAADSRARSRCATTTAPAASLAGGVMCPSYRVTRDERDVTRGRANTLRLAVTGQLGPDALASDEMAETLEALRVVQGLPARMPDRRRHGAHEDRGAGGARQETRPLVARPAGRLSAALRALRGAASRGCSTARNAARRCGGRSETFAGFSARRSLPRWRARHLPRPVRLALRQRGSRRAGARGRAVRRHLQPLFRARKSRRRDRRAGRRRLSRACGAAHRTATRARSAAAALSWRSALVEEAKREMQRTLDALAPYVKRGVPVIGLEPSCLFSFRDELPALIKGEAADALAGNALLFEEFLAREHEARRACTCRSAAAPRRRCCTAIATRRPSTPWARSKACCGSFPGLTSRRSNRAAAAWPAPSATTPTPSTSRSRWASCRCCRRCARRRPTR